MIDFDTLDGMVTEKGPACPDLDCGHAYCVVVRTLRDGLSQAEGLVIATPPEVNGERERCPVGSPIGDRCELDIGHVGDHKASPSAGTSIAWR